MLVVVVGAVPDEDLLALLKISPLVATASFDSQPQEQQPNTRKTAATATATATATVTATRRDSLRHPAADKSAAPPATPLRPKVSMRYSFRVRPVLFFIVIVTLSLIKDGASDAGPAARSTPRDEEFEKDVAATVRFLHGRHNVFVDGTKPTDEQLRAWLVELSISCNAN